MPLRRISRHLAFWMAHILVLLFNQHYLYKLYHSEEELGSFIDNWNATLMLFAIRVPMVYYTLYSVIPRWFRSQKRFRVVVEYVCALLLALICYRLLVAFVVYPYILKVPRDFSPLHNFSGFIYSFRDLAFIVGTAAAIKLFQLRIDALKKEKVLIEEKKQSEMMYLRAQINPHFLFNTLNSIYSLARRNDPDTSNAVMRLSKLLRHMLYETERRTYELQDELNLIEDYIALQKIRFGNRLVLDMDIRTDDPSAQIPPLVILPLLENAIKHGNREVGTEIQFTVVLKKDRLTVQITNSIGALSIKPEEKSGIGLINLRRQLELQFSDFRFTHHEFQNQFIVDLTINLRSYANPAMFNSRG